ncbi:hypothetical protein BV20DRAFT_983845 [Pilatotrama ljubarskyi]|nr:hypothetical protein BV20DRAFT_983845 [Pilatotrama ljubarskyi]
MPVDNSAINIGEELLDDATETIPIAKGVWSIAVKCLSTGKIRAVFDDGQDELHDAGEILYDPDARAALERIGEFDDLLCNHSLLEAQSIIIEKLLGDVNFFQFSKKYKVRVRVIKFKKESPMHKRTVRAKSDRARLGLDVHTGTLPGISGLTALSEANTGGRSEETLVAGAHSGVWRVESRTDREFGERNLNLSRDELLPDIDPIQLLNTILVMVKMAAIVSPRLILSLVILGTVTNESSAKFLVDPPPHDAFVSLANCPVFSLNDSDDVVGKVASTALQVNDFGRSPTLSSSPDLNARRSNTSVRAPTKYYFIHTGLSRSYDLSKGRLERMSSEAPTGIRRHAALANKCGAYAHSLPEHTPIPLLVSQSPLWHSDMSDNYESSLAGDAFIFKGTRSTPFVKLVWKAGMKPLNEGNMLDILADGKEHLNHARDALKDPICRTLLSPEEYHELTKEFSELLGQELRIYHVLRELKKHQVIKRYKTWLAVMAWQHNSTVHKHTVWSRIDWDLFENIANDATMNGNDGEDDPDTEALLVVPDEALETTLVVFVGEDHATNGSRSSLGLTGDSGAYGCGLADHSDRIREVNLGNIQASH